MSFATRALAIGALLLASSASAQQTIIVDQQGGAGAQFTEIQPAINAALPGDLILVRPVTGFVAYAGFTVSKSLRIVGGPGVKVGSGPSWWSIGVENLEAGGVVVLKGFTEDVTNPYSTGLVIQNNAGTVHCEDLAPSTYVVVANSQRVAFHDCQLSPVKAMSSNVLFVDCTSNGYFNFYCSCHEQPLDVSGGRVTIAGGAWIGGDGFGGYPGGAGIRLRAGRLLITGDFDTVIRAGTGFQGAAAIRTDGGEVVLDPDPVLTATGAQPLVSGPATVQSVRVPFLVARVDSGALVTSLNTWIGAQALLLVGPSVEVVPVPGLPADLWVGSPIIAAARTVGGAVHQDIIPLPPLPPGLALPLQYLVVHGGTVALSNPDVKVLDP